jgi:hypothetical protein
MKKKRKGKAKFLRGVVFELIKNNMNGKKPVGATNDEMQVMTHENSQTLTPRTRELVKAKLVCNSGGTRPTRKERPAIVWIPGAGAIIDGRPNTRIRPPTKTELVTVAHVIKSLKTGLKVSPNSFKQFDVFMKWVNWLAST